MFWATAGTAGRRSRRQSGSTSLSHRLHRSRTTHHQQPRLALFCLLLSLLLLLVAANAGGATAAAGRVAVNPFLFGYNLEVLGTMVNNSFDDTAVTALGQRLRPGALRYPGGTMSNVWNASSGRYELDECARLVGGPCGSSYAKFAPFAAALAAQPAGTFAADRFLASPLGRMLPAVVFNLNVYTNNHSAACAEMARLKTLMAAAPPGQQFRLELGNEFYSGGQGLPRFPSGQAYGTAMAGVLACARQLLPGVPVAVVGRSGEWNHGLRELLASVQPTPAVTMHDYNPATEEVDKLPAHLQHTYVAGYSLAAVNATLAAVQADLGRPGVEVWMTEFNYGLQSSFFLPELEFGALHGIFHVARVLAAVHHHPQMQAMLFQTFVHPLVYTNGTSAFHRGMPVSRLAQTRDRPDLVHVSGTAQVYAAVARLALGSAWMAPANISVGDMAPISILNLQVPCLLGVVFGGAEGGGDHAAGALVLLNVCNATLPARLPCSDLDVGGAGGQAVANTTTFVTSDPGGWVPMPADFPSSGPLTPVRAQQTWVCEAAATAGAAQIVLQATPLSLMVSSFSSPS